LRNAATTNNRDQSYELKFELGNQTLQIAKVFTKKRLAPPAPAAQLSAAHEDTPRHYASESP
jgi:hypothetical protein